MESTDTPASPVTAQLPFKVSKLVVITAGVAILVVLAVVVLIVLLSRPERRTDQGSSNPNTNSYSANATFSHDPNYSASNSNSNSNDELVWRQTANGYEATSTPPSCAEPLVFDAPVNVQSVTSILYPGQTRGGNYKPHGGFRFDTNKTNVVDVVAPMDGYVVSGVRHLVDGEIQYGFDFIHPCGIMYRLGHLRELTPKLQAVADKFPQPTESSAFTNVNPPVKFSKSEKLATKIGIMATQNTFVDWGVFDLRQKNQAAQDPNYMIKAQNNTLASYAICWLNNLGTNSVLAKSLPAGDPTSGKNSDYCN